MRRQGSIPDDNLPSSLGQSVRTIHGQEEVPEMSLMAWFRQDRRIQRRPSLSPQASLPARVETTDDRIFPLYTLSISDNDALPKVTLDDLSRRTWLDYMSTCRLSSSSTACPLRLAAPNPLTTGPCPLPDSSFRSTSPLLLDRQVDPLQDQAPNRDVYGGLLLVSNASFKLDTLRTVLLDSSSLFQTVRTELLKHPPVLVMPGYPSSVVRTGWSWCAKVAVPRRERIHLRVLHSSHPNVNRRPLAPSTRSLEFEDQGSASFIRRLASLSGTNPRDVQIGRHLAPSSSPTPSSVIVLAPQSPPSSTHFTSPSLAPSPPFKRSLRGRKSKRAFPNPVHPQAAGELQRSSVATDRRVWGSTERDV